MTPTLLILKTGSTFPSLVQTHGDFEDWIRAGLSATTFHIQVVDARHEPLPEPQSLAGVVITGSHAMVSDREPWSERASDWLRTAVQAGLPVLGICYGHQLLAHCMGGVVGYHPQGIEIGSVTVGLQPAALSDPLLGALPRDFPAQVVHRQSVRTLPEGAVLLAGSAHEPHQAFRVGSAAWGVQFHPEFSQAAMQAYIGLLSQELRGEGHDAAALEAQVVETLAAASVLQNFLRCVHKGQSPALA